MTNKTYLIYGVSKGLGKALTQTIPSDKGIVMGIQEPNPVTWKITKILNGFLPIYPTLLNLQKK